MAKEVIATKASPQAIGPYSQAIKANGMVFTAGQIPLDPATGKAVAGDIKVQTERVMRNLEAILEETGASFATVVKTTCFLADLNNFAAFNEVYGRFFTEQPPARSTIEASRLPAGVQVEVECIALCES